VETKCDKVKICVGCKMYVATHLYEEHTRKCVEVKVCSGCKKVVPRDGHRCQESEVQVSRRAGPSTQAQATVQAGAQTHAVSKQSAKQRRAAKAESSKPTKQSKKEKRRQQTAEKALEASPAPAVDAKPARGTNSKSTREYIPRELPPPQPARLPQPSSFPLRTEAGAARSPRTQGEAQWQANTERQVQANRAALRGKMWRANSWAKKQRKGESTWAAADPQREWKKRIPAEAIPAVIGTGGSVIRQMQEDYGVKIDVIRETSEVHILEGSQPWIDALPAVLKRLDTIVAEKCPSTTWGDPEFIPVPKQIVGKIIGKGGEEIKRLESHYKVRMVVLGEADPELEGKLKRPNEAILKIWGAAAAVVKACKTSMTKHVQAIFDRVQQQDESRRQQDESRRLREEQQAQWARQPQQTQPAQQGWRHRSRSRSRDRGKGKDGKGKGKGRGKAFAPIGARTLWRGLGGTAGMASRAASAYTGPGQVQAPPPPQQWNRSGRGAMFQ